MNVLLALASVVIKEIIRRKDFYVLFVLTALITLGLGAMSFFGDPNVTRYLKDACLSLIWISGFVISIGMTARQIPAECESRTIFPLLAKPVTRAQVIVGKFLGCWVASGLALLVFYTFLFLVSGSREHHWPLAIYLQVLWLHWILLGVVVALAMFGSVVFSAPSANATICFVVVFGVILLGKHLRDVALKLAEPGRTVVETLYFAMPHLEWYYDVRQFLPFDHGLIGGVYVLLATLYGLAYVSLFLFCAWLCFRRRRLNL